MPGEKQHKEQLANDFVDVKDISDIFLYTRTKTIICFLRIYPFNLELKSEEDVTAITHRLAATYDGDRKDFDYCTLPRELDLDKYKNFLKEKRMEEIESIGKKHIIDVMIGAATELTSSNENFEHYHFIKIWQKVDEYVSKAQAETDLRERITGFRDMYKREGIQCEILRDREIIKLCNLFSNRRSANYDITGSVIQTDIPMLR